MKQTQWEKILARKVDIQKASQFAFCLGEYFPKMFNIFPLSRQILYFDGRTTHQYVIESQYSKFKKSFRNRFFDINFLTDFRVSSTKIYKSALKEAEKIVCEASGKVDNKKLIILFKKFERLWNEKFYAYGWILFFTPLADEIINKILTERLKDEKEILETTIIIS